MSRGVRLEGVRPIFKQRSCLSRVGVKEHLKRRGWCFLVRRICSQCSAFIIQTRRILVCKVSVCMTNGCGAAGGCPCGEMFELFERFEPTASQSTAHKTKQCDTVLQYYITCYHLLYYTILLPPLRTRLSPAAGGCPLQNLADQYFSVENNQLQHIVCLFISTLKQTSVVLCKARLSMNVIINMITMSSSNSIINTLKFIIINSIISRR